MSAIKSDRRWIYANSNEGLDMVLINRAIADAGLTGAIEVKQDLTGLVYYAKDRAGRKWTLRTGGELTNENVREHIAMLIGQRETL